MIFISRNEIIKRPNNFCAANVPCLFMISYEGNSGFVLPLSELAQNGISCSIHGKELGAKIANNYATSTTLQQDMTLQIKPVSFKEYEQSFSIVKKALNNGDTYLLNLTFPTTILSECNLPAIYSKATAPYKFLLNDEFVFYSPEPFIRISNNIISSFPMKGTISANISNAQSVLLKDEKELREHYTIVDLIRNDLSIVADNVKVDKFRYVEPIHTPRGDVLQTSSKISGELPNNWADGFGTLLFKLLPAGSICGAPKKRTTEIINRAEISERGFYTGVMGIYKDKEIDSCVLIRFIEHNGQNDNYNYHSGGGITSMSCAEDEYNEMITKIYVPIA